jgi:hypothetical protein
MKTFPYLASVVAVLALSMVAPSLAAEVTPTATVDVASGDAVTARTAGNQVACPVAAARNASAVAAGMIAVALMIGMNRLHRYANALQTARIRQYPLQNATLSR